MKNRLIKLFGGLLTVGTLAFASCSDEEFVREGGQLPDKDAMTNMTFDLQRIGHVNSRIIMSGSDVTDILRCRLSHATTELLSITFTPDMAKVETYGKELKPFPEDHVTLFYDKSIAPGKKESGDLSVNLQYQGVEPGRYLLPLTAQIGAISQTFYYDVYVLEKVDDTELDTWDFKVVSYVNTEVMNPMVAAQFTAMAMNMLTEEMAIKTWIDIEVLRPATLKYDKSGSRVVLDLGPDLQYVLNNRDKYIIPLQKSGRKVLICLQGGNDGIGFRNLNENQIGDLVYQIKYLMDNYHVDGINFMDIGAGYEKNGSPTIIPTSYAKLIKATKEALGDKSVTIACDPESTECLAVTQDGIDAGQFIDHAWPAIFDKVVDAYAEGSELKPIAGLDRSKYGSVLLQTHDTGWQISNGDAMTADLRTLYRQNSESANVFAFYDMPPARSGIETGAGEAFKLLTGAMIDENLEYDGMIYDIWLSPEFSGGYGRFTKDW